MRSVSLVLICAAVLGMMILQAPYGTVAEISCEQVKTDLGPCGTYFAFEWLSSRCCPAVKGVIARADTQANRQSICRCFVSKYAGSDAAAKAEKLAEKCGVAFDTKIDCSTVK